MYLAIKETKYSPSVRIITDQNKIIISGESRLEDPAEFYQELTQLFDENIGNFKTHLSIDFRLKYMNSSSSKWLFHILKNLQKEFNGKKIITINWFFDVYDESMQEAGEVFQSLLHIPFNIIELS